MMNMWKNSDPKKVFNLSNKINKMELSDDAKSIYTKLLLTNTYSPEVPEDEKIFFDIKSEWLMKYKDVELIKDYVLKNIDIIPNEKLIKLGKQKLLTNNVLILEISSQGQWIDKQIYDMNDMNEIKLSSLKTENKYGKKSFVYDFLSSMRQKINDPLGKRKKP